MDIGLNGAEKHLHEIQYFHVRDAVKSMRNKMKSIFKSKTFWVNVLGGVTTVLSTLPLTSKAVVIGGAVVNIVLRILTTQPVSVLPQK